MKVRIPPQGFLLEKLEDALTFKRQIEEKSGKSFKIVETTAFIVRELLDKPESE